MSLVWLYLQSKRQVIKSCFPEPRLCSEMFRLADPQALYPSGPSFLPILWPHSWLWWHLPSSRHKDTSISGLGLPPVILSLQACPHVPADSLVLLPGGIQPEILPSLGDATFHWWRGNPIQHLLVSFLTMDLPLRLQHQGVIYVFKLVKRLQCPCLENRAQWHFLVYTCSDSSMTLQRLTHLAEFWS